MWGTFVGALESIEAQLDEAVGKEGSRGDVSSDGEFRETSPVAVVAENDFGGKSSNSVVKEQPIETPNKNTSPVKDVTPITRAVRTPNSSIKKTNKKSSTLKPVVSKDSLASQMSEYEVVVEQVSDSGNTPNELQLKLHFESKLNERENEFAGRLKEIEKDHEEQIALLQQENETQIELLSSQHAEIVNKMQQNVSRIQAEADREIEKLKTQLVPQKCGVCEQYLSQIEELKAETSQYHHENSKLKGEAEKYVIAIKKYKAALAKLKGERAQASASSSPTPEISPNHSEVEAKYMAEIEQLKLQIGEQSSEASEYSALRADYDNMEAKYMAEIEQLKLQIGEQSSEASEYSALRADYDNMEAKYMAEIEQLKLQIGEQSSEASEYSALRADYEVLRDENSSLLETLTSCRSTLSEREKSMESMSKMLGEVTNSNNEMMLQLDENIELVHEREGTIGQLNSTIKEHVETIKALKGTIANFNNNSKNENSQLRAEINTLRSQLAQYQESMTEKDEKIMAYAQEGQALAKKQADMEKAIRKSKTDMKEKDKEISKLKENKDELTKVIAETQELMRKHETNVSSSSKSVVTLQTVNNNLQDKIYKLESEILTKSEELANQKKALEGNWSEISELKRECKDLRTEKEELVAQLGKGTNKVLETESTKRDAEQREAILKATNEQLQEHIQRVVAEASTRDERLRSEVQELRQRWQEAVRSRETLSSELASATAPLLRQITSSQESLRSKTEHFHNLEASMSEKIMQQEALVIKLEKKCERYLQDNTEVSNKVDQLTSRIAHMQGIIDTYEKSLEQHKAKESDSMARINDLESKLAHESLQNEMISNSMKDLEVKYRDEISELNKAITESVRKEQMSNNALQVELELHRRKTGNQGDTRNNGDKNGGSHPSSPSKSLNSTSERVAMEQMWISNTESILNEVQMHPDSGPARLAESLPSGALSYAAAEKNMIDQHRKSNAERLYVKQIQHLEMSHSALSDELSYMTTRNLELEEFYKANVGLQQDLEVLKCQNECLLTLLGEKTEELEACMLDLQDVKGLYREQLDDLIGKQLDADAAKNTNLVQEKDAEVQE